MSGFGLVAGVVALFFAFGIVTGVLGVMALSALRGQRIRGKRSRNFADYDLGRTPVVDWNRPANLGRGDDDLPPPWPGRRG